MDMIVIDGSGGNSAAPPANINQKIRLGEIT
jgi:hypothetical protein